MSKKLLSNMINSKVIQCETCNKQGPTVIVTSLGLATNPGYKPTNASAFKGATILRTNGSVTTLEENAIEWVFLSSGSNEVSIIVSVGNSGVKTIPVAIFYEQNPQFGKLEVNLGGEHEGCRQKLIKAGVNVL